MGPLLSFPRRTVDLVHLEETGHGQEVRVVFDVRACPACGASFRRLGTYRPVPTFCHVHLTAHYDLECRACQTVTADYDCDVRDDHDPLEGHRKGPGWYGVQDGPTADYGDG